MSDRQTTDLERSTTDTLPMMDLGFIMGRIARQRAELQQRLAECRKTLEEG